MKPAFLILLLALFISNSFAQWSITGNSGTTPGTNFLGTTDNQYLVFKTNNVERLRLLTNGNLLLGGTTDDGYRLDVTGTSRFRSSVRVGSFGLTVGVNAYAVDVHQGIRVDDATYTPIRFQASNQGSVLDNFVFENTFNVPREFYGNASVVNIKQGWGNPNTNGYNVATIRIENEINTTNAATYTLRGIYYNPTITNLANATHIAFENTVGNNRFNSTGGNTLIGTTTDNGSKLQVNGGVFSTTGSFLTGNNRIYEFSSTSVPFKIDGSAAGQGELAFRYGSGGAWYYAFYTGQGHVMSIHDAGVSINRNDNTSASLTDLVVKNTGINSTAIIDLLNSSNSSVFMVKPNGNVGIGIATPSAQLHSTGTVRFAGLANDDVLTRVIVSDASGNLAWRDAATLGGSTSSAWAYGGNTVGMATSIGTADNYSLPFITNNVERMRIGSNGNVGIGTTLINDAGYKLFVEGAVRARKVRVDQTVWSDYVFYPGYYLRPLSEVERFIKKHQHLPEVPSAAEVEKEGIDLGNNQAVLLKKIEELTLYIIEQNKRIEQLEKTVKALNK